MTDKDFKFLISKAKQGDSDAFGKIYQECLTPIYRFIFFRVRDKSEADDLTQEVFVKVFGSLKNLEISDNIPIMSYFYTVARNLLIDTYRKKRGTSVDIEDLSDILQSEDDLEKKSMIREDFTKLKIALDQLSSSEREVVLMKFAGSYSNKEIAVSLSKSEDAVRQLQSRGLRSLREILKNKGLNL